MGAIIGVSVFVGALVLGIRYSLVLGVLGFFFEMVPMIGPTLIGAAMVLAALLTSFKLALIALVFYLLLQLLESNVLGPRITGHAVGLHPIASMLGLVAGAKLFGLWGALFAVPVLGFAFVVIAAVYRQVRGLDPDELVAPRQAAAHWPVPYPAQVLGRFRRRAPDSAQGTDATHVPVSAQGASSAHVPVSAQGASSTHAHEEPLGVASALPERSGDQGSDRGENDSGGDATATVSPATTVRPGPGHAA
jgi:cation transporter-like permease